jgi:hypothetical protein
MRKQLFVAGLFLSALFLATAAAPAHGIDLYYKEVERAGRIYVFTTAESYRAFEASGQAGAAITLVGRAVDGRTLIAENQTAVDLYLFKHDLEPVERPAPEPAAAPFTVSWKNGKTSIESEGHELKISNRVQIRFTEQDDTGAQSNGSFRIRRAKTKFEGWAYDRRLTYTLQANWVSSSPIEDAWVDYDLSGDKQVRIRAGRFKAPFGRQELTSSGSLQFVDRSIVSAVSDDNADVRENGVMLHGTRKKLDWSVGAFNGAGRTATSNDNNRYQFDARAVYSILGKEKKPSEVDFESDGSPILAVGAGYHSNDKHGATTGNDIHREILGYDVMFKLRGFSAFVELFEATDRPESGQTAHPKGMHGQAGYLFDGQFDVAIRYASLDLSPTQPGDDRTERGLSLSYFWNRHARKLQADYREIEDEVTRTTDRELRVQFQIVF